MPERHWLSLPVSNHFKSIMEPETRWKVPCNSQIACIVYNKDSAACFLDIKACRVSISLDTVLLHLVFCYYRRSEVCVHLVAGKQTVALSMGASNMAWYVLTWLFGVCARGAVACQHVTRTHEYAVLHNIII